MQYFLSIIRLLLEKDLIRVNTNVPFNELQHLSKSLFYFNSIFIPYNRFLFILNASSFHHFLSIFIGCFLRRDQNGQSLREPIVTLNTNIDVLMYLPKDKFPLLNTCRLHDQVKREHLF